MNKLILLLGLIIGSLSITDSPVSLAHENETTPVFNIEDYSWLVGSWTGDGFGGISQETWSEPVNGTMMGMYRHIKDGELVFYEFLLLDETGIRLKHFNPDLTGWEEKDDMTSFEMISFSKDRIEMKGLTFEKKSDTEMTISLKMRRAGEITTEVFNMKRD
ncbi:MAG: hypothetical protein CL670_16815 [Balneola sp.]|jgi:hypothetical protein|nr:hypothetical protein [Balneola sp.]MBE80825.1 hypothetical protein [Balneola sp.]|tara:strand:+ start:2430 stop:2912 length:483 start_codon:yes stop_codon:yes gene_type:complete